MARNKSEKLPSCPEAHAYADAVEADLLGGYELGKLWNKIPGRIKDTVSQERRFRKPDRGPSYFSAIKDLSRRDYHINADIIREWYGT